MILSEEAKKARAIYIREWRKKNPDKVQEYEARRWEKKAQEYAKRDETKGEKDHE